MYIFLIDSTCNKKYFVVTHKFESECQSREETLGLLHGIGRVIHPKSMFLKIILLFL